MNPNPYIHAFALIAIIALSFQIFSEFYLPICLGALGMFYFAYMLRR